MLDNLMEEIEEAEYQDVHPRIKDFTKMFKSKIKDLFTKMDKDEIGLRRPQVVEYFNRLSKEAKDPKW